MLQYFEVRRDVCGWRLFVLRKSADFVLHTTDELWTELFVYPFVGMLVVRKWGERNLGFNSGDFKKHFWKMNITGYKIFMTNHGLTSPESISEIFVYEWVI